MPYIYSALCGNTRVRDNERLFFISDAYSFGYIVRWGRITVVAWGTWGRGGRVTAHKKYKNKCKSPKAATTEGTTNCYMEADACIESLLTNNCFRPIPFARYCHSDLQSLQNAWNRETKLLDSKIRNTESQNIMFSWMQKYVVTILSRLSIFTNLWISIKIT